MEKECCGNCEYYFRENIDGGWVCVNGDSDYVAEWTEVDFICDKWEKKE